MPRVDVRRHGGVGEQVHGRPQLVDPLVAPSALLGRGERVRLQDHDRRPDGGAERGGDLPHPDGVVLRGQSAGRQQAGAVAFGDAVQHQQRHLVALVGAAHEPGDIGTHGPDRVLLGGQPDPRRDGGQLVEPVGEPGIAVGAGPGGRGPGLRAGIDVRRPVGEVVAPLRSGREGPHLEGAQHQDRDHQGAEHGDGDQSQDGAASEHGGIVPTHVIGSPGDHRLPRARARLRVPRPPRDPAPRRHRARGGRLRGGRVAGRRPGSVRAGGGPGPTQGRGRGRPGGGARRRPGARLRLGARARRTGLRQARGPRGGGGPVAHDAGSLGRAAQRPQPPRHRQRGQPPRRRSRRPCTSPR